jgi:hypothetical protein
MVTALVSTRHAACLSRVSHRLGIPVALSNRPQQPWYLVGQLTTTITSRLSSDFHYNYTRNLWIWSRLVCCSSHKAPLERGTRPI